MTFPIQPGQGGPADNTPAVPSVGVKPLRIGKWGALSGVLLVVLYLGYSLMHDVAPSPAAAATKKAEQQQQANSRLGKVDVPGFTALTSRNVDSLLRKKIMLQSEAEAAGLTPEQLTAITATMPPCNANERRTLNGQTMYMVNAQLQQRVQLDCGTDDAWHALPKTAEDLPVLTPQQQAALDAQRRGGGGRRPGGGGASGQTRQDRLNAALASSSVVEFAEPAPAAVAAVQAPAVPPVPVLPGVPGGVAPGADAGTVQTADQQKGYPWDTFTGPLYHVFGGPRWIDCVLQNRMQGEFTGPVVVMVRTAVYSWDRQHVLIPRGTVISGTSSKVSTNGQRRLAVNFDRMIMPDGYAVPLKDFIGLDQQGAAGLTGKVNTHWPKIIGTAALVGAIGGLSQIGGVNAATNGWSNVRAGVGSTTGQEATQILQQTYNTLPTVTVYEGTLVNVWVLQDLLLPAVENHTVSSSL